jgi:hypothetical protein
MKIEVDLDNTLIKFNVSWFNRLEKFGYKLFNHEKISLDDYSIDFKNESIKLFNDEYFLSKIPMYLILIHI